jgi:hypothetical protein
MPHLIIDRGGQPALDFEHVYAPRRRPPLHLRNIAGNTPDRLILSRTRSLGIDLSPIGLPGLVLDPRVGLHITVLAVASRLGASVTVMTATQSAVANIAAYGRSFLDHEGARLQYGLHGRVPYEHLGGLGETYHVLRLDAQALTGFERWFLPLVSLKDRNGIHATQLPALLKYYRRALPARGLGHSASQNDADQLEALRAAIRHGETDWLMRKPALTAALRAAWQAALRQADRGPRQLVNAMSTQPGPTPMEKRDWGLVFVRAVAPLGGVLSLVGTAGRPAGPSPTA